MTDQGDNTITPLDDSEFVDWLEELGYNVDSPDLDVSGLYVKFNEIRRRERDSH